ncbi:MAG: hypothetical protein JWQ00_2490 [Noviherbaspirillum sp.]|nr:hypothetical protein [Noviherbaspirillum sp.]
MAMTQAHGTTWRQITEVYQQWDQDRYNLMSIDELADRMPHVEPEMIGETLAEALMNERARGVEESGSFRLIPNH